MKFIRLIAVLCLCLISLMCTALAADTPTIEITPPEVAIPGGSTGQVTVTSSVPGFLTLTLYDAKGSEVAVLFDRTEIHSKENDLNFAAVDMDGNAIAAGQYTVTGSLTSQFGETSAAVSETLLFSLPTVMIADDEEDAEDGSTAAASGTATANAKPSSTTTTSGKPSGTTTASTSSSSTSSASSTSTVAYTSAASFIGEEGYQIGVGVTDIVPQSDGGYWSLSADAADAEIWAAIIKPLVGVDVGEQESSYIYDSVEEGHERLGTVSGISQGLNVIARRDDGWSLVEAFRNEDGAFVRGYIRTNRLRTADPNTDYGIVIDKATQTLTVYHNGARIGSCAITSGLPTQKYLYRETPAGEFITVTRRGTIEYYGNGYSKYTIRINGNYHLSEIPSTKKNGSNFSLLEDSLGTKATRGNICIAHDASSDGGINAAWIWDMTDSSKRVKVLIFDDKDRGDVPVEK